MWQASQYSCQLSFSSFCSLFSWISFKDFSKVSFLFSSLCKLAQNFIKNSVEFWTDHFFAVILGKINLLDGLIYP